ncbi:MAG TPA: galactosyl transferase [Rhizobiaceae bacterium]|nr:galactosyl transferase [Rhizobiaceae bacterium]
MTPVVTFVIPVRHQDNAKDWHALKANLAQTIASIAGQTHPGWRAVIVANDGADLPKVPTKFEIVRVDFPPNALHEQRGADKETFYEAFRVDKGRRVLKGMLAVPDSRFFMIVDDDDLVSNRIVEFAARNTSCPGWTISRGYSWSANGSLLFDLPDFHHYCGTSLIVRSDLYRLPERFEDASLEFVTTRLGGHRRIVELLAEEGNPLQPLPFHGAIYRIGHAGAHSGSSDVLGMYFLKPEMFARPHKLVTNLFRLKFVNRAVTAEFFGPPPRPAVPERAEGEGVFSER